MIARRPPRVATWLLEQGQPTITDPKAPIVQLPFSPTGDRLRNEVGFLG